MHFVCLLQILVVICKHQAWDTAHFSFNYLSHLVCPYRYFGMDCSESCSGHCINNETCDHVSGVCTNGCQDGYTGSLCTISKIHVWFTWKKFDVVNLFAVKRFLFINISSKQLAKRVITAETALFFVLLIVRRVDTQMGRVLARKVGWVQAVQQVFYFSL